MYYLLVQNTSDEDKECRRIQAVEPELCRMLVFERASLMPEVKLSFHISPSCLQLDCLQVSNAVSGRLCSQRFTEMLTSESIPFIAYPVQLLDEMTGKPIEANYSFWIPRSIEGAIDWESSEVWINPETGKRHLSKLVLTAPIEAARPLLFQSKETGLCLVHDKVRTRLQTTGITGVAFAPLDAASMPPLGAQKLELERILQRHPDNVEDWCKLSGILWQLHRQQEALVAIDRALTLKPDLEAAWRLRGHILYELEHLQEALEAFKQAIQANPQSVAWKDYSAVLLRLGSKEEALASAEHLVQIWSSSPVSWYELGAARAAIGHAEEALQAFEEALRLGRGPRLIETYLGKGEMLYQLGYYEEAQRAYRRGLELRPWKRELWEGKAKALRALGRPEEAEIAEEERRKLDQEREKNLKARPL